MFAECHLQDLTKNWTITLINNIVKTEAVVIDGITFEISRNIKDGFIINIGVNFDIIVLPNFNSNEVLTRCILALQEYFAIDRWQINQPIVLRDIYILLDRIEGVQTVKTINITNLVGESLGYSKYAYDINGATADNVVYPSLDPSIFEVKYPNQDIQGRVVPL